MSDPPTATTVVVDPRDVTYTHLMYALHAAAVIIGMLSAASIAIRFVFGAPSIIAVVMNYARRNKVQGTWLASHYTWQWRTFWWAFLWVAVVWLVLQPLVLILMPAPMRLGYLLIGLWVAYRVVRGWLALKEGRTMPVTTR